MFSLELGGLAQKALENIGSYPCEKLDPAKNPDQVYYAMVSKFKLFLFLESVEESLVG